MKICVFILLSSLPTAWIAVECLLLILLLIVTVLFILKSREVTTLKKRCEELSETMRMMRYEEANLSRMLHTASSPMNVVQPAIPAVTTEESEPIEEAIQPESIAKDEEAEEATASDENTTPEEVSVYGKDSAPEVETPTPPQLHKQAINERRPAIPTDLFAAWFAENDDSSSEEPVTKGIEKEEEPELIAPQDTETQAFSSDTTSKTTDEVGIEATTETIDEALQATSMPPSVDSAASQKEEPVAETSDTDIPTELSKEDERFCRKLERIVNTRLRNPNLNIDIIAAQFGIGRTNFYRKVRELTGISPNDYLRKCRMERAAELLGDRDLAVSDVCIQVGMPDAQYFSRVFKAYFGVSPSTYREQNNQ